VRTALRNPEQVLLTDVAWLRVALREPVMALFAAGQRIPQEALGTRVLARGGIGDPV
jgi:hypothetical protein